MVVQGRFLLVGGAEEGEGRRWKALVAWAVEAVQRYYRRKTSAGEAVEAVQSPSAMALAREGVARARSGHFETVAGARGTALRLLVFSVGAVVAVGGSP